MVYSLPVKKSHLVCHTSCHPPPSFSSSLVIVLHLLPSPAVTSVYLLSGWQLREHGDCSWQSVPRHLNTNTDAHSLNLSSIRLIWSFTLYVHTDELGVFTFIPFLLTFLLDCVALQMMHLNRWVVCPRFSSLSGLKLSATIRPGKIIFRCIWTDCVIMRYVRFSHLISSQSPRVRLRLFPTQVFQTPLKIKASYHKASHSPVVTGLCCVRLHYLLSGPYYLQIDG